MNNLFFAILNMSVVGSFVIAAICLTRLPLKKAPKIFSYCLWIVAGFRLVIPFSIESILGLVPFGARPITPPQQNVIVYASAEIAQDYSWSAAQPSIYASANEAASTPVDWLTLAAILWLVGFAAMAIYGIATYVTLKRKMRNATHVDKNIYRAENIPSPFVLGVLHPRIYIPSNMPPDMTDCVIFHEETHIRRKDYLVKFMAYFILCLHWFNPLVWIAFILMESDMEMACDEYVLKNMGSDIIKDYSLMLVSLATTRRRTIATSPLAFGEGGVKERVKNVLKFRKASRIIIVLAVMITLVLSVGLGFNMRTNYVTLVLHRDIMEIVPMSYALTNEGIRNRRIHGNTGLQVDSRRIDDARALLIAQHLHPQDQQFTWADAFDGSGLAITESQRRIMNILAIEAEIENQLLRVDGIQSASVTLNVPEPTRVFRRDIPQASAAATLVTTRGFDMHEGRNLAMIITSSVVGLELENVHIIDQHARTIFSTSVSFPNAIEQTRHGYKRTMQSTLMHMLWPIFDEVNITVDLVWEDIDSPETIEIFTTPVDGGIPSHRIDRRGEMGHPESAPMTHSGRIILEESSVVVSAVMITNVHQTIWLAEDRSRTIEDWQIFVDENTRPTIINDLLDINDLDYLHNLVENTTGIPQNRNTIAVFEVFNFIPSENRR